MPTHTHNYKDIYLAESLSYNRANLSYESLPYNFGSNGGVDGDNAGYQINRTSESTGKNIPHNNLQPYRIIKFIQYVGT